ncbi:MAG: DNA recombination protein RmuC [Alphaproteobacteria bacterium]|nr:DNA recombination protein RmuC [Alphaproteobacteria bacterium]
MLTNELSIVIACVVAIIFLLINIKQLSDKVRYYSDLSVKFHDIQLESAKLQEKCDQFDDINDKYSLLLNRYANLEKENVILQMELEQERKNLSDRLKLLETAENKLTDTFKSISAEALSKNNQSFLDLAKSVFGQLHEKTKADLMMNTKSIGDLVTPIKQALDGVDVKLGELEKSRIGAYESLKQQVGDLISTQNSLKKETCNLVAALKAPSARGRWGEMQLRRIVELSGMMNHCDFQEQVVSNDQDRSIRPDMVIYYPGNKKVIVDSKAPLSAYFRSLEIPNGEDRKTLLQEHAKLIRRHILDLSKKEYWSQFPSSPEFVIMFLPGEVFFSAAMEQDPLLIEFAMQKNIIMTTPSTLLALLHTISWGWQQENLANNAKQIVQLGKEMHKRLNDMLQHFRAVGRNITSTVQAYNQTVASLESRVLVSARKFNDIQKSDTPLIELPQIEQTSRQIKD